jgi:hypothetical protein
MSVTNLINPLGLTVISLQIKTRKKKKKSQNIVATYRENHRVTINDKRTIL